ncbi:histidine--tRNA ligase [Brachybacterium saurashtrense]|uniref:Histidine--tRNA ligase n=1 Tax=Brachybacterium saurashtrense TaxID=556288 RepID=A0A345YLZ1_9MICO|nr:histidine--tRNA ligase [Brachybacterium saurashtrense]AXK44943.1 histidine--tRNA ligase [Brachybacterium saurashtrense]RRR21627.1 histidine--tRNA ligase [Brachybacterium saurashtrense]
MAKIAALSGFPEWLPAERLVEQHVIDVFREVAELHGFSGIETRAVEPLEQLLRKGEIDKEVYVLRRLHAEEDGDDAREDRSRTLGLHFDLTVPLARYVLEHQNDLAFPLRRFQIQKVWRGERPQDGRFREFYQADLDVIGQDTLPGHIEAEVAVVMAEILDRLPVPAFTIHANTRRLSEGFFRALGLEDQAAVLRSLDKLPKIGEEAVRELLLTEAGATEEQARACLAFAAIRTRDASFAEQVRALGGTGEMVEQGIAELTAVLERVEAAVPGVIMADLSIARGLDYYTGTVFETFVTGHESLGSICSGGRYDALASDNRHTYPGVGLSIGLSRLVSRLLSAGLATASRAVPTCVLVSVGDESLRELSDAAARSLRRRGIACEVAPTAAKFGKQIRYADRRGIPFIWFPGTDGAADEVKDIRTGEQVAADAGSWEPPAEDRAVRVLGAAQE